MGDALSLSKFNSVLARETAMAAGGYDFVQSGILTALSLGALMLLVVMVVRRSGTAAAGSALLVLTALCEALLFGTIDFVTQGTKVLIGTLSASAFLLFVNAVLHTGRENLLVAAISALVIIGVTGLGVATATGTPLVREAWLGCLVAMLLASGLLVYAVIRDPIGKAFLAGSVVMAVLCVFAMTNAALPLVKGAIPVIALPVIAGAMILSATLIAPFIGQDVPLAVRKAKPSRDLQAMPTSLFAEDDALDVAARRGQRSRTPARPSAFREEPARPAPAPPDHAPAPITPPLTVPQAAPAASDFEPQAPDGSSHRYEHREDPVSNHWAPPAQATEIEMGEGEYVWDVLAEPEVRCGGTFRKTLGNPSADMLTPEGIRQRLDEVSLDAFDEGVLGGSAPQSGPFDVTLETGGKRFRFEGRRRVDHEGILLRIDGEMTEVQKLPRRPEKPEQTAAKPTPQQELAGSAENFRPMMRLPSGKTVGIELTDPALAGQEDAVRSLIDRGAHRLAGQLDAAPRSKPFGLIDAAETKLSHPALASAVGKAVRGHDLPRGVLVVGLQAADPRALKAMAGAVDDYRKAGAAIALIVDDPKARPPKFRPDMVWISAMDVTGAKVRRTAIAALEKRFGCPVLVRDVDNELDLKDIMAKGAHFATGRAFAAGSKPAEPNGRMADMRATGLR